MLGFRLKEGLDLEVVASSYGQAAVRRVEQGVAEGLRRGWVIRDRNGSSNGDGDGDGSGGGGSGGRGTSVAGGVGVADKCVDFLDARGSAECVSQANSVGGADCGAAWRDEDSSSNGGIAAGDGGEREAMQGVGSGGSPGSGLGSLRLSDPEGFLFSNAVISSVFCELDGWKRDRQERKGEAETTGR